MRSAGLPASPLGSKSADGASFDVIDALQRTEEALAQRTIAKRNAVEEVAYRLRVEGKDQFERNDQMAALRWFARAGSWRRSARRDGIAPRFGPAFNRGNRPLPFAAPFPGLSHDA